MSEYLKWPGKNVFRKMKSKHHMLRQISADELFWSLYFMKGESTEDVFLDKTNKDIFGQREIKLLAINKNLCIQKLVIFSFRLILGFSIFLLLIFMREQLFRIASFNLQGQVNFILCCSSFSLLLQSLFFSDAKLMLYLILLASFCYLTARSKCRIWKNVENKLSLCLTKINFNRNECSIKDNFSWKRSLKRESSVRLENWWTFVNSDFLLLNKTRGETNKSWSERDRLI